MYIDRVKLSVVRVRDVNIVLYRQNHRDPSGIFLFRRIKSGIKNKAAIKNNSKEKTELLGIFHRNSTIQTYSKIIGKSKEARRT